MCQADSHNQDHPGAILFFGNGRRVPVEFDPATCRHLLAPLPGCRRDTGRR